MRNALVLAVLSVFVFAGYLANGRTIGTGDSFATRVIPLAILTKGTVYLDDFRQAAREDQEPSYWLQDTIDGHRASLFPIVTAVLATPFYIPAVIYLNESGWEPTRVQAVLTIMEKVAASIFTALSAAFLYAAIRRRGLEFRPALFLALAYAFGTDAWVTASQSLWLHAASLLISSTILWLLSGRAGWVEAFLCGACLALLALNRPPDVILGVGLGIAALIWAPRLWWMGVVGGLTAGLPFLAYNLVSGGHPVGIWVKVKPGPLWPHYNPFVGILGLLISPFRGLLVFTPFLAAVPVGILLAWKSRDWMALAVAAGVVSEFLFYSASDYRAGHSWGARYLLDLVPAMIWLLVPAMKAMSQWWRGVMAAGIAASVCIQAIGAFRYMGLSNIAGRGERFDPLTFSSPLWQLENLQWAVELQSAAPLWKGAWAALVPGG